MQLKRMEKRLRQQKALLIQLCNNGGFTLTELLVVVIISSVIVSALLGLVVQLVGTEQRESVRTETQREMQLALNYIAADLRQAVYIYEGTEHPEEPVPGQPSYLEYIPAQLQEEDNYLPVLAFWKTKTIDDLEGSGLPNFDLAETGPRCSEEFGVTDRGVTSARSSECNNLWLKRQNYSLVVYLQAIDNNQTNANGRWDGKSRIVRYELDKYSDIAELERNAGYVDPAETGSGGFTGWPFGPTGADGRGGIENCQDEDCGTQTAAGDPDGTPQTLVDFVDFIDDDTPADQVALRDSEPDNCGALNIPGDTPDPNTGDSVTTATGFTNYYMLPRLSADNPKPAFFVCLKNTRDPNQPGEPRVGQIQDTVIFLRGNANGRGGTGSDSFLPTLQTRVTMRGVIDRVIR